MQELRARRRSLPLLLVAAILIAVAARTASATSPVGVAPTARHTPIPAHVYAPYFETWATRSITTTAQRSGTRYYTLAFLGSLDRNSCTLAWNGDRNQTLASGHYLSDIASLRALGGDVFPLFGGQSADEVRITDSYAAAIVFTFLHESAISVPATSAPACRGRARP
jgi:hypothetical protein